MNRDDALRCEHGKLFCVPCDMENGILNKAASETGHERECRCRTCATIRRDARRANRQNIIEVTANATTLQLLRKD